MVSNLSILFLFKYFDFFIDNVNRVLGHLGMELLNPTFDVILPVGISFYTFQALSYTMDVYRGEIYVEKNLFKYALFVSLFPQLVAGLSSGLKTCWFKSTAAIPLIMNG